MSISSLTTLARRVGKSRANHFAPSHHKVAQAAPKNTPGLTKNRKLKVLGFMPIMALLLTPAVLFAGVLA